ncbi:hypothetical protein B0H14DRAFT_384481 [Mycena olivaceomarginata]|nr:hypothetical protein B0H14DRAFT_384481 [Mycena olivaceomarginata]
MRAGRFGSSRQHTGGWCVARADTTYPSIHPSGSSSQASRDLYPARGGDAPRARLTLTHPPSKAIESLPRFEKIKNAESGGAECRPVPCTRGSTAPARSRVLSTPSRSGVCPGAGRGWIAAHRTPSSVIHPHALAASQHRAHYTRAPATAVLSIGAAAGEHSPPQVAAEILRDGAERSNRCKQPSLGLDYTNQPTSLDLLCISSTPRRAPAPTCIRSCLPDFFATYLISSRRALPHLDYATMRFRGDAGSRRCACAAVGPAGSGSSWGHCRLTRV